MRLTSTLMCLVALSCVLLPSTAMAQDAAEGGFALGALLTSTTVPLTVAGLTIGGGLLTTVSAGNNSTAKIEMYLRHNEPVVAHVLNTGFGRGVDDLASLFGVPTTHKSAFAKMLRANRKTLLALSDAKKLNKKRTHAFISHIVHNMYNAPEFKHMIKVM